MTNPRPEPAVGQVWLTSLVTLHIEVIMQVGPLFLRTSNHYAVDLDTVKKWWMYLGTLDELRARATAGDLLYTDNSAVVAKLSAENERLRAELAKLKAE